MKFFEAVRRVTIFILGVFVILEGLYDAEVPVKSIILGMIMIGCLPLEDLIPWSRENKRSERDH